MDAIDKMPPAGPSGAAMGHGALAGFGSRQIAGTLLREMAQRKRREADQLDALAGLELSAEQEEALWSIACGYLHR